MTFKSMVIFTENSDIEDGLLSEVIVCHGYNYLINNHAGLYIILRSGMLSWDEGTAIHNSLLGDLNGHVNIIWRMLYVEY